MIDSKKRVLLLWHKRLERWMPPGGHIDEDELPEDAARRECKEETGLDVDIVSEPQSDLFATCPHEGRMLKRPVAMLLENIPASLERNEPAHRHMDFVFLAKPIDETQETVLEQREGDRLRWFTSSDIAALDEKTEIFGNVKHYLLDELDRR